MSSPAVSCARRCTDTASSYCSRQRACTIASRKLWLPSTAVCQAGRGSEPMIEVGSTTSADALSMGASSRANAASLARVKKSYLARNRPPPVPRGIMRAHRNDVPPMELAMTPLPTVSHPAVSHPSTLLRRVLYADAAISGLSGLVMALDAAPLENLLAVPRDLLRTAGISLLPWA